MHYRYLRDPVFLCALAIYLINKFALKPYTHNAFVHGYVVDIICMPFWIPILLLIMRKAGLRSHDGPPRAHEILIPLLFWSWAFEVYLPQTDVLRGITIADNMDVLSYAGGALAAVLIWKRLYREDAPCEMAHSQDGDASLEEQGP